MKVSLVSITHPRIEGINTAEELIVYCARVSNPSNQLNVDTAPKLINYLIKHKHWSPFEMASMCVEIETSRAIAQQIIRHRSFSYQEFSQRYASVSNFEDIELRKQAEKNRQSSTDIIDNPEIAKLVSDHISNAEHTYRQLLEYGVAREVARFVLPLNTQTRLYMNGSIRSWITYLMVRLEHNTQKEHRLIAQDILHIFAREFPIIFEAMNGFEEFLP